MLMPTSSEFVALCRSQITLLTQALGATLSVVYLTEELVDGEAAQLVPIAAFPETPLALERSGRLALLPIPEEIDRAMPRQLSAAEATAVDLPPVDSPKAPHLSAGSDKPSLSQQRQLVLPLMHEDMVLGLLVTERDDRGWNEWECSQIERIAQTIALGCVLDQRAQWLDRTHHQQRLMQAQQHDVLDNLLHQFRNPLTALRTFGKLLMRRLQSSEGNYDVASSIVRESDRLQELLKQFDQAVDLGDIDFLPLNLKENQFDPESHARALPLLSAGSLTGANLQLVPCSVVEILSPLLVSTAAIAQEKGLLLRTALPTTSHQVWANASALCEVLSNLIDNALKYTPAGEQVHIRIDASLTEAAPSRELSYLTSFPAPLSLVIRISDTGVGIPPQDLPHVFERHYRGVQATTQIPGTGLGLAIAHSLMRQMQGDIQVFSPMQPEGWVGEGNPVTDRGTTFAVWLTGVDSDHP